MPLRPSAAVVLLGCPKNQVDAEHVLGSFVQAGYRITPDASAADVIVITTCAFLRSAVRESEAVIASTLKLKLRRPGLKVVVAGCLVERLGARLAHRFPDVDLWVRLRDMHRVPALLTRPLEHLTAEFLLRRAGLLNPDSGLRPRRRSITGPLSAPRLLSTPRHLAYLRIADGCSNHCAYCLIPSIRGEFRSRPMPKILAEARALVRAGVRELVLVAQDTTLYGTDIHRRPQLARLLHALSGIAGLRWLRLMYAHPAHLTEDVIDELASNPKLCRYIDLPLQHVSDRILAAMNRPYVRSDIDVLLSSLRAIPDLHVRTTLIVGFPGETEHEFAELLDFVRSARIDRLSAYAYSPEDGTRAARLARQVPAATRRSRLRRLMLCQAAVSRANLRRLVGRELTVLVDARGVGRTEWDAPEVDGVVHFSCPPPAFRLPPSAPPSSFGLRTSDLLSSDGPARSGSFVRVRVTRTTTHDIHARVI